MIRIFWITLLIVAGPRAGIRAAAPTAAPAATAGVDLYFKPPEFTAPAISPDGRNIGFIAQNNGHACLFKLDRTTGQISGLFSAGEGEVEFFWWIGNQRVLIAGAGEEGREYFVQDLGGGKPRPMPILQGLPRNWITILPQDPDHVVALNFWQEAYLARVNLNTGHSTKIESFNSYFDERFLSYLDWRTFNLLTDGFDDSFKYAVVSATGELRAKIWQFGGKWHIAWRARAGQPWHTTESSAEDLPVFTPAGMAADNHHILVYAHDQGRTEVLMQLDPDTDQRTLLASRSDRDIYELVSLAPLAGSVGVQFSNYGPEDITYFDPSAREFSEVLARSLPGMSHRVTSSSTDGSARIVEAWLPGYPPSYYLFDAIQHHLSLLGVDRPDLAPGMLGDIHFFHYQTRDGFDESGYVLVPQSKERAGPVPLIILAPQSVSDRASPASLYNAENQYFASRGFAVAHLAVRGTAGFGRDFLKSGDFQFNGKIIGDLEDGIAQLARDGIVDPRRVALVGVGHGGLFALRAAANSTAFHAVVAREAQCDLTATAVAWMSSSRAGLATIIKQAGGTQAAYALAHQFEPESFVENISAPVLLVESDSRIRDSLEKHHKAYEIFDRRAPEHVTWQSERACLLTKIADYLDKTMR